LNTARFEKPTGGLCGRSTRQAALTEHSIPPPQTPAEDRRLKESY